MWMLFRRFKAKINTDVQKEGQEKWKAVGQLLNIFIHPIYLFGFILLFIALEKCFVEIF
jgi:hypothetical protein